MNLELQVLENIEAPLSNDFWTGVGIGAGIGLAIVAIGIT